MPVITCCNGIVLGEGYEFCPRCGRRTGRLGVVEGVQPQLSSAGDEFDIVLSNVGVGALPVRVKSVSPYLMVVGDGTDKIPRGGKRAIRLKIKPGSGDYTNKRHLSGVLTLLAEDDDRKAWWQVASEREYTVPLQITISQPAQVTTPAKALIFTEAGVIQCFYLHNEGDLDSQAVIQVPEEFAVSDSSTFTGDKVLTVQIPKRRTSSVWIKSLRNTGSSDKQAIITTGASQLTVLLRQVQSRAPSMWKPTYVVGIDFGTRNTSMYLRNVADGTVSSITGEERFPSVLYVDPQAPQDAMIGTEAVEAWNNPLLPVNAILVESMKTLVRRQQEVYVERYGPDWTILKLLGIYFNLLYKLIDTHLSQFGVYDLSNVLVVFTVPVLDNEEQFSLYKSRMHEAAVAAGFADDDDLVWFLSEPQAAALYVAHVLPDLASKGIVREGLGQSATICVVDAGGGTTDICFGELRSEATGRWTFDSHQTLSLNRNPTTALTTFTDWLYPLDNPYRKVPLDNQVGGNAIDIELAYNSIGNFQTSSTPHFITDAWKQFYPDFPEFRRIEEFLDGTKTIKEDLSSTPSKPIDIREEIASRYDFQRRFNTQASVDVLDKTNTTFQYAQDIVPIVQSFWQDSGVGGRLKATVENGSSCDFVVPIGGTTLLPEFVQQIRRYASGSMIELPKQERVTAVARGSVWAYDPKIANMLPVGLKLSISTRDSPEKQHTILRPYQPVPGMRNFDRRYQLAVGDTLTIDLEADLAGSAYPLATFVRQVDDAIDFTIIVRRVDDRTIRVFTEDSNSLSTPIWEVRV